MSGLLFLFPGQIASPALLGAMAAASALLVLALQSRRSFARRLLGPAFVAAAVMLPLVLVPSQRRDFVALYRSIRPGMTAAQVKHAFETRFPLAEIHGWPTVTTYPHVIWFTLDPRTGTYNSEFIEVSLAQGCVSSKTYLPD